MPRKRQFSGTSKSRTFFDRKVQIYGYTRMVAMGKVLPKDWRYVRLEVLDKDESNIVLKIHKLLGSEVNAQTKATGKAGKQNT